MPVALLVTVSPRLPGLLAPAGWRAVTAAPEVLALPGTGATAAVLRAEGIAVTDVLDPAAAAAASGPGAVLLATPEEAAGWEGVPRVAGAPEPPGARLLDVVGVMDRLRSPGGCPWDAEQTHASLRGYLLEEAHEAYDAIVDDDPVAMREELGDVLLQVAFHARVAAEAEPGRRFDVDDVAGDLVDKLVRRHPHVFSDAGPRDVAAVERGWDEIKKTEKQRRSPTEGVSRSQPASSWGAALAGRAARAGLPTPPAAELTAADAAELGEQLLGLVVAARQRGWDAEDALRTAVRRYADELDVAAHARG
ncbi:MULTISPECIES: MazG family protein [unclassified Modestobacter]|uniref:MazG family protein n=1 Tax=unclassified Modestobacter TaxID=2643866 RepID=UPI0022AAC2EA|nr:MULTISPECIES: MazG family protein [unclassified Modestobacter]MCZ2825169.1 MazG family protein [Modestobacter sp. VKM Ac-2981]MCZ2853766.1 MazG family protein [Modestobacter sp. VKM Ac-2982]